MPTVNEREWTAEEERVFWEGVPDFPDVIHRLMEERGIESIEELHRRVIENGLGGIDRYDRNVSRQRFERHVNGTTGGLNSRFLHALDDVLKLTEKERLLLIKGYYKRILGPAQ